MLTPLNCFSSTVTAPSPGPSAAAEHYFDPGSHCPDRNCGRTPGTLHVIHNMKTKTCCSIYLLSVKHTPELNINENIYIYIYSPLRWWVRRPLCPLPFNLPSPCSTISYIKMAALPLLAHKSYRYRMKGALWWLVLHLPLFYVCLMNAVCLLCTQHPTSWQFIH